jgi:uncharacterized membrane protein
MVFRSLHPGTQASAPALITPPKGGTTKSERIIQGAVASLLAIGVATAGTATFAAGDFEKCAGVAKAGKNDCGTSKRSCPATAKMDRDSEAWILVPTGTCDKIAAAHPQMSEFAKSGGKSGESACATASVVTSTLKTATASCRDRACSSIE